MLECQRYLFYVKRSEQKMRNTEKKTRIFFRQMTEQNDLKVWLAECFMFFFSQKWKRIISMVAL